MCTEAIQTQPATLIMNHQWQNTNSHTLSQGLYCNSVQNNLHGMERLFVQAMQTHKSIIWNNSKTVVCCCHKTTPKNSWSHHRKYSQLYLFNKWIMQWSRNFDFRISVDTCGIYIVLSCKALCITCILDVQVNFHRFPCTSLLRKRLKLNLRYLSGGCVGRGPTP